MPDELLDMTLEHDTTLLESQSPAIEALVDAPPTNELVRSQRFRGSSAGANAFRNWSLAPRFLPRAVQKAHMVDGGTFARNVRFSFLLDGRPAKIVITPAQLEIDGEQRACFPGPTEQAVEVALLGLHSDPRYGRHHGGLAAVCCSLGTLQRELKRHGFTFSKARIAQAIRVMKTASALLEIVNEQGEPEEIGGNLVLFYRAVRSADRGDGRTYSIVLPAAIETELVAGKYRQFNSTRYLQLRSMLARYLQMRMTYGFDYADRRNRWEFDYSEIARETRLLESARAADNRASIRRALDLLVTHGTLRQPAPNAPAWHEKPERRGREVIDATYTLFPSKAFVAEQIAANFRAKYPDHPQLEPAAERVVAAARTRRGRGRAGSAQRQIPFDTSS